MTFKIEKPGKYVTEDGRKVTIETMYNGFWWGRFKGGNSSCCWQADGTGPIRGTHIVGRWKDRERRLLTMADPAGLSSADLPSATAREVEKRCKEVVSRIPEAFWDSLLFGSVPTGAVERVLTPKQMPDGQAKPFKVTLDLRDAPLKPATETPYKVVLPRVALPLRPTPGPATYGEELPSLATVAKAAADAVAAKEAARFVGGQIEITPDVVWAVRSRNVDNKLLFVGLTREKAKDFADANPLGRYIVECRLAVIETPKGSKE